MVTVTNYSTRVRKDGTTFIALEISGGVELVQSNNTGKFYATVRKTSIPSTCDEAIAIGLIGFQLQLISIVVNACLILSIKSQSFDHLKMLHYLHLKRC